MGIVGWLQLHWLDFLQSVGIIGGLLFTAVSIRTDSKVQRISNLRSFTKEHREIWTRLYDQPKLARIIQPHPDLDKRPVTHDEEMFVNFVILHLSDFQETLKQGLLFAPEGLQKDVRDFFSLPIPHTVWEKLKPLQDQDFVAFVEKCRRGGQTF
jgi:hypothetical protein